MEKKVKYIYLTDELKNLIDDINKESKGYYKKKDLELSTARVFKYLIRKLNIKYDKSINYKYYKRHYNFFKQLIKEGTGNFLKSLLVKGNQKLISGYDFEKLYSESVRLRNDLRYTVEGIKNIDERNSLYDFIDGLIDDITRPHLSRERMIKELEFEGYTRSTLIVNHNKIIKLIENRHNSVDLKHNDIEEDEKKRFKNYNIQEYQFIKGLIIQMMNEDSYLYNCYKYEVDKKSSYDLGDLELSQKFYDEMLPSINYAFNTKYSLMLDEMLMWLSRLHYEKIIKELHTTLEITIAEIFSLSDFSDINQNLSKFNNYIKGYRN